MHSTILTIGIVLGVCSITLLALFVFCYAGSRVILAAFAPAPGSNAHLKQWLLSGGNVEEYCAKFQ